MSNRWLFGAILILVVLLSHASFAHSRFNPLGNIPGRSTGSGLKTGPCGGIIRTATFKAFAPGQAVRVDWEETVQHPGRFEFYFSQSGDSNFSYLATVIDDQNDPIPAGGPNHVFTSTLTLPNVTCTDCTLQMVQVMTENSASPSYYYSCADIQLSPSNTAPPPLPLPVAAPNSTPPICH